VIGRLISRAEALRISRETLEQAERERTERAECEAVVDAVWDEEVRNCNDRVCLKIGKVVHEQEYFPLASTGSCHGYG
jgi:hypothetical protein